MKKVKAVQLMREGKKITHIHFSPDEWMTIEDSEILLEDGVKCNQSEFWKWRTHVSWEDGYSLFVEEQIRNNPATVKTQKNIPCKVVHSESKDSWNIIRKVLGEKYKIARIPYVCDADHKELSQRNQSEARNHAEFIMKCFNNRERIEKEIFK